MATLARVAGVFVRERGTRVKDRGKNGASKIPFLVLSWLRNQTEKLATQANATRNLQLLLLLRTVGYMVLALKLWPSVSITVVTWWLFLLGCPFKGNAQSRNTSCSYRKKTKWRTEFLENCSCPSSPGADFCVEGTRYFRSSGEQTWKSIWNEHKIILWSYWPYICAELLSKYSIRWGN